METCMPSDNSFVFSSFKSYYVVWKPEGKKEAEAEKVGLNRTM